MHKNPIGLHILFALLGLGASLLFLGIGGQGILQMQTYGDVADPGESLTSAVFCLAGVLCLVFSIGLILRLEWAKTAFQVMLILGGIAWEAFVVIIAIQSPQAWAVLTGMAAAGLMIALFGVLFLESPHFRKDMKKGQAVDGEHWDILDQ